MVAYLGLGLLGTVLHRSVDQQAILVDAHGQTELIYEHGCETECGAAIARGKAHQGTRPRAKAACLLVSYRPLASKPWLAPRRLEPEAEASRHLGAVHRGCSGSSWRSSLLMLHRPARSKTADSSPLNGSGEYQSAFDICSVEAK